jgi:hypothetical protein
MSHPTGSNYAKSVCSRSGGEIRRGRQQRGERVRPTTSPGAPYDEASAAEAPARVDGRAAAMSDVTRHTRSHPCCICGGHDRMPRGRGNRCHGYQFEGIVYCARAQSPRTSRSGLYMHRPTCRCSSGCTCEARGRRLRNTDGKVVCWCINGCTCCWCGVEHGTGTAAESASQYRSRRSEAHEQRYKIDRALEIWHSAVPISGTLGRVYLESRGITLVPGQEELRYAAALKHSTTKTLTPALVAPFRNVEGKVVGVERIYLLPDGSGKADLYPTK